MAFIGTSGLNNLICFRILFRTARFDRESNYVCMKVYMYVCMYVCMYVGCVGGGGVWESNVSRVYVCMVWLYVFMYSIRSLDID
mgnify:FL=1